MEFLSLSILTEIIPVYLGVLALTILVEVAIAVALCRVLFSASSEQRSGQARGAAIDLAILNLFTHPVATWAHMFSDLSFWTLEGMVVIVEALALMALKWPIARAVVIAVICNAVTAALSFL